VNVEEMTGNILHSDPEKAAFRAQNLLCFHYQICYTDSGQPKRKAVPAKPKPTKEELLSQLNTTQAFPNPADGYITIAFKLYKAMDNTVLQVFDNSGRLVEKRGLGKVYKNQELIDTRQLPNGVYLYQIVQDGEKVANGKFVLTH
jgi:hypothetical protein